MLRKRVLVYAGLCFYAFIAGLPVYWMLITSFKPDQDLYNLRNFPLFFNELRLDLSTERGAEEYDRYMRQYLGLD